MDEMPYNPFRPWRHPVRLWRVIAYDVTGFVTAAITFSFVVAFLAATAGLLITFVLAVPFAWMLFVVSRGFGKIERSRIAAMAGVRIGDPVRPFTATSWFGRLRERVRSGARWREIAFHLVHFPVAALTFALTTAAWAGSAAMLGLPAYVDSLPGDSAKFYFFEITSGPGAWAAAGVGALGFVIVAPWITIGLGRLNVVLARALLGPSGDAEHAAQVERLESSRTAAVDSAEAERRRIERDLHDGAQQRLVALAADLGAAKEKLDTDPEAGRELVVAAHEEAKAALKEIRDLVRGIHPVILEDRGLDAALSAIVSRCPVPVTLEVDVATRPAAPVESAAYFVVTEALTNVAKHANATKASVSIARAGDRLVVEVRDNGEGGADPGRGSGLQGLRDRVAGLGGSMYVISPPGGPTTLLVELPCGS